MAILTMTNTRILMAYTNGGPYKVEGVYSVHTYCWRLGILPQLLQTP